MATESVTKSPFRSTTVRISLEAHRFLKETTDGVCHFTILSDLLTDMATEETTFLRYGYLMHLYPCQVCASANELSRKYNIERAKMWLILYRMEKLHLLKRRRTDSDHTKGIAPVATITALQSWENRDGVETPNLTGEQTQESGQASSQNLSFADGEEDVSKYFDHEATSLSPGSGVATLNSERKFSLLPSYKMSGSLLPGKTSPESLQEVRGEEMPCPSANDAQKRAHGPLQSFPLAHGGQDCSKTEVNEQTCPSPLPDKNGPAVSHSCCRFRSLCLGKLKALVSWLHDCFEMEA